MIDICDYAVGLSRQLYGLAMHSERPSHRMYEQWHPLGAVGVITAFNFPVAVWAWNAAIAAVCGDTVVWKPSHKVPLCAIAVQAIADRVAAAEGFPGIFTLVMGSVSEVGERMLADPRLPLISATGSTRMGRRIAEVVGPRMGRTILELGGNNAIVAIAVSGVRSEGFQITGSPQTSASAAFQLQTATGKLKALITATGPSGCHVSVSL